MTVEKSAQPAPENIAAPKNLGAVRTLMAANRTLMAWIRTSLSMFSFGFTIYKVLDKVQQLEAGALPSDNTPRNAGLFLIVAGTVAIVMGTIEYRGTLSQLRLLEHFRLAQPTLLMALLMAVAGVVLCVGIITRFV